MNVVDVPVDLIDEDPSNPNRMTPSKYEALKTAIRLVGFKQSTIVEGPLPSGRYRMRDGNHRLRVARELGMVTIPSEVEPVGSRTALAGPLMFNNIRGEIDQTVAAGNLDDLVSAGWSMDELAITGFTDQEVADLVSAAREPSPDAALGDGTGEAVDVESLAEDAVPGRARPFVLEVEFADRAAFAACRKALRRAAGKGRPLAEGLAKVLGLEPSS